MSGNAKQRTSDAHVFRVCATILLLLLPWGGLWRIAPTTEAIRFSAFNFVLMVPLTYSFGIIEQLVVALTARGLGDRMFSTTLGIGPVVHRRRVGLVSVVIRAFPSTSDDAVASSRARYQSLRFGVAWLAAAIVVGAPAFLAIVGVVHVDWRTLAERLAPDVLAIFISGVFGAWGLYIALLLVTSKNEAANRTRRLMFWVVDAAWQVDNHAYDQAIAAAQRGLAEVPDDLHLALVMAMAKHGRGDPEAFELVEELRRRELPQHLKPSVLNVFAWACCVRGDLSAAAEADEASREAVAHDPTCAAYNDTRGHVLIWLGRAAEAEPHLTHAYAKGAADRNRGSAAAGLAMLYAATKRPDEAAQWLARARELGCEQRMLARAVAAVDPLNRT